MWSIGCILSEMILQRPLLPGKDAPSQVRMIVYYFGTPEEEVLRRFKYEFYKKTTIYDLNNLVT